MKLMVRHRVLVWRLDQTFTNLFLHLLLHLHLIAHYLIHLVYLNWVIGLYYLLLFAQTIMLLHIVHPKHTHTILIFMYHTLILLKIVEPCHLSWLTKYFACWFRQPTWPIYWRTTILHLHSVLEIIVVHLTPDNLRVINSRIRHVVRLPKVLFLRLWFRVLFTPVRLLHLILRYRVL